MHNGRLNGAAVALKFQNECDHMRTALSPWLHSGHVSKTAGRGPPLNVSDDMFLGG